MANRPFLSQEEERHFIRFVAQKGENYDRYLEWCEEEAIPEDRRYTPGSFHNRVNKDRQLINRTRMSIEDAARESAVMTKDRRIGRLQRQLSRIEEMLERAAGQDSHECTFCENTHYDLNVIAKIEDQYRKTLESIARELGEYNRNEITPPADPIGVKRSDALDAIKSAMVQRRIAEAKDVSPA